jgi:hypothetical protein
MTMLCRVLSMWVRGAVATGLILLATACSGGADDTTTTTDAILEVTTTLPSTSTSTSPSSTLAPVSEPTFPEYTIARRVDSQDGRDTVVVLLDPDSYNLLSDVDLHDVLAEVVDRFPPVYTAHVVDSAEAVDAVLAVEPTEEQLQVLSEHYLVSLEEGFRIVFRGPFAELGTSVLGS